MPWLRGDRARRRSASVGLTPSDSARRGAPSFESPTRERLVFDAEPGHERSRLQGCGEALVARSLANPAGLDSPPVVRHEETRARVP
jgi:hypothetical protein